MTMIAPNMALQGRVGPSGSFGGYYLSVPASRGLGAYRRRRRSGLGQHWYDGIVNAAENVAGGLPYDAPVAGGGSVTANGVTTYVDSSGNPSAIYDPVAGTTPSIIPDVLPTVPTWLPVALGIGGLMLLLGFSGVGKLIPRANPSHRRRRRHSARAHRRRRAARSR